MTKNQELLELAAKAAGWVSWDWLGNTTTLNVYDADGSHDLFAPLTDDGDALRLAVKLGITIYTNILHAYVRLADGAEITAVEEPSGEIYAATRRAIVRAAAEIGRQA